ncbi:ATP-binding protein [Rosettibacter firmus]|uniref:ATP-binding protein n=1 Tax=Rosettibacter firmus TaxID=3111522 RepID=UPI00336BF34C
MKDLIKRIIVDFIERDLPQIKDRSINIPLNSGKIISIVGARRTGKTFLLYLLINKLRAEIPSDRIVYFNFEDDRLFPPTLKTMDLFLQSYYELFPDNKLQHVYFFFDEIQLVDNWEKFIRRIYDNEKCSIFITGSSSKLLIKELSTALRGRSISYELFPLDFKEYLSFNDIEINIHSTKSVTKIINIFNKYVSSTSFPELINMEDELKQKSLREYLDLIIYKDIVERYGVSNIHLMKYLIRFLFSNSGNLISINKIYNELKSSGLNISRNSVYEYISYLEDSYIIFNVKLFTRNLREQFRNPSKYFTLDNGLKKLVSTSEDKGKLLESIVFMHLRRRSNNIYYYLSEQEIDFVLSEEKKLINVCYDLSSRATRIREINSFLNGLKKFKNYSALLLTNDEEGEEIVDGNVIKIMPVWKWILLQE